MDCSSCSLMGESCPQGNALIQIAGDGTIIGLNSRCEELFGYTQHELIGCAFNTLLASGDLPEFLSFTGARSGVTQTGTTRVLTKTGHEHVANLNAISLKVDQHSITSIQIWVRGADCRWEPASAFESQVNNSVDKLWKVAANTFSLLGEAYLTDEGMKMRYFGDATAQDKLGVAPDQDFLSFDGVLAMMHPDDTEKYSKCVERAITKGEPFNCNYRISDGLGGWRWLKSRACSIEQCEGRHVRFLHDTIDITDLKSTEDVLRKTVDELEQLKTRLLKENLMMREQVSSLGETGKQIVGQSAALNRVLQQVELVAVTDATVLIGGETGTGKELVARAIHRKSTRRDRLFVAVNCAALPATLVESELFGHEKGAFTGAGTRRTGRFEQADGSTLFLDEVGELPLETQSKMLRVLQSGEYERVGANKTSKVDVRIIAASNLNLEQAVNEGRFRSDLYHRLAVFPINLPPLRDRRTDIPLLAAYIVARLSRKLNRRIEKIPKSIMERLSAYSWPGNIRELENVLERAIILSPGSKLNSNAIQLETKVSGVHKTVSPSVDLTSEHTETGTLQERERMHILHVCEATGWKIKGDDGAAVRLGLNPGTLYARMKKLGIKRP